MYTKCYHKLLLYACCGFFLITGTSVLTAQGDITPSGISAINHPKFVNPLPIPVEIDAVKHKHLNINMRETTQWLGLVNRMGTPLQTRVWGYGPGNAVSYPGPTIRAGKDEAVDIAWRNQLPDLHLLPVDYSLHMARPGSGIPVVAHLHGGHTESASDGLPEAWYTKNFQETGPYFVKKIYHYDNDQDAATLWYHDHALGYTRLNVYAGLAGFYLLSDEQEEQLIEDQVFPQREYEIEVVIQDRSFTAGGRLMLPTEVESEGDCITAPAPPMNENPVLPDPEQTVPATSAVAEFFGDFILVNGMTWPVLNVEPRKYRIRLLNGSDSRFYALLLDNGSDILQIGSDDGLLPQPVSNPFLTIAPGERYDLILDFKGLDGQTITVLNAGPDSPFKGYNYVFDFNRPTGKIMQFKVNQPLNPGIPDATVDYGSRLTGNIGALYTSKPMRKLALFEGRDQYCRLRPQLGTVADGSLLWDEPVTEKPMENSIEKWRFYNATEDAHPVHIHLVKFQVQARGFFMGEVAFDDAGDGMTGGTKQHLNIMYEGAPQWESINTKGWKDTEIVRPNEYIDVIARYDRPGRYVWHCHILSHEDHEMMRPFEVGGSVAPLVQATPDVSQQIISVQDQTVAAGLRLEQNVPNPFKTQTQILFKLPEEKQVALDIYNLNGQLVKRLANQVFPAGEHTVLWDGRNDGGATLANGMYVYRIMVDGEVQTKRLMMNR